MPGRTIRHGDVLNALTRQCSGSVKAGGNNDAADRLLRTMTLLTGQRRDLCALLRQMHDNGTIVIETSGNRFDTIALPDTVPTTESGGNEVAAGKGQHRTTSPRTADCHEIGSTLDDSQVGPVTTSYPSKEIRETVVTTAELVVGEFHRISKERMGRDEALAIIQAIVLQLNPGAEAADAATTSLQVLSYLVEQKTLSRHPSSRRNAPVYSFNLPEPKPEVAVPDTLPSAGTAMVEQLVKACETLEERNTELTRQLEELRATSADPELLEQLTGKLEEANAAIEGLRRQIDEAGQARQQAERAHGEQLDRLRAEHGTALREMQEKLDESLEANRRLEAEHAQRPREIPADLRQRMQKLGVDV